MVSSLVAHTSLSMGWDPLTHIGTVSPEPRDEWDEISECTAEHNTHISEVSPCTVPHATGTLPAPLPACKGAADAAEQPHCSLPSCCHPCCDVSVIPHDRQHPDLSLSSL